MKSRN